MKPSRLDMMTGYGVKHSHQIIFQRHTLTAYQLFDFYELFYLDLNPY